MLSATPIFAQESTVPSSNSAASTPERAADGGVGEIVVTAQKREQNLQDVPISITAINSEALQANRIADVRDLSAVAPNLTVRVAAGGSSLPNYSMRGIVTSGSAAGSDKGVSLYLDGVYVQNVQGSIFELADVERIEVLKGPQGTLFGRNATGGAISIITRDPTGEFGIRQELTYGNYDRFRSKTRVDLPRFGPFSASVTYLHSERRGDTRNLGAGTRWDYGPGTGGALGVRTSPKYLGDENIESVGAAVKMDLVENLDLTYRFDYSENHYTPEAQGVAATAFGVLGPATGGLLNAMLGFQPNPSLLTPVTIKRPRAVNNWYTTPSYIRNMGHNLTARYAFNDEISVKNILAFRSSRVSATYQLDGLGGLVNVVTPAIGPIGAPFVILGNTGEQFEKQWSNETQLNVDTDWFNLTAGYIHFHDRVVTGGFEGVPNVLQFRTVPNFVIPANGNRHTEVKMDSDAVFVQPEFHLTDKLDLVLGSRLTIDRKKGLDRSSAALGTIPFTYRNSKATWLAGVNYKMADNILTYAKYATGYISGGFLATLAYEPETSKSWEAGVKADLFDRRFRSNLAVFSVKYGGIQFNTSGLNVGIPAASQVVVNGGDGKAKGFEWENTLVPVEGLTLTANVGYTDFKYTSVNPVIGNIATYLPQNRPKWTANGSIQYKTSELVAGGRLVLRADANYKSKTFMSYVTPTQAIYDATVIPHSWIVNGRIALSDLQIGGSTAEVSLWGRNLFDNKRFANITTLNFLYPGSYERARTYGVDLSFQL